MSDGIKIIPKKEIEEHLESKFNLFENLSEFKIDSSKPPVLSLFIDFDDDEETKGYIAIDVVNQNLGMPMRMNIPIFNTGSKEYTSSVDKEAWKSYKNLIIRESSFFKKLSNLLHKHKTKQVYIKEPEYGSKDFELVDLIKE